jgi:hypothetical protein
MALALAASTPALKPHTVTESQLHQQRFMVRSGQHWSLYSPALVLCVLTFLILRQAGGQQQPAHQKYR